MPYYQIHTSDFPPWSMHQVSDVAAQLDGDIDDVHHHIKRVQHFLVHSLHPYLDHSQGGLNLFQPYIDALDSIRWLENYFKIQ